MVKPAAVLLVDDGELDDVQAVLDEVGVSYGRVRGGAIAPGTPAPSKLLVTTPRRIQAIDLPAEPDADTDALQRIVVVSEDSTTLRAHLREIGFDYLVRRPTHPEALRLLILHCLYAGEERRSEPRVPMGFEISFRSGLLPRRATLADLSTKGARLLSKWALEPGRRITVTIPESAGLAESVALKGRVLRMTLDEHLGPEGPYSAAVAFDPIQPELRQELEWILEERRRGPATLKPPVSAEHTEKTAARLDPPETRSKDLARPLAVEVDVRLDREGPEGAAVRRPPRAPAAAPDRAAKPPRTPAAPPERAAKPRPAPRAEKKPAPAPAEPEVPGGFPGNRRHSARHAYQRRVPAFGERAMRVLVARDLSMGGMRVDPDSGLELNDRLHLAIYGSADEEPLLVWATVARDDGSNGMALTFDAVHPSVAEQLEKVVADLPAIESLHDDEARAMGTVVSEILDH